MVHFLIATALAAASPQAPPALPAAQATEIRPAMFAVRDADTTVFIFGTFHALDGKSQWLDDRLRNAFEHSDELVLETLVPEKPSEVVPAPAGFRPLSVTPSASFLATARMAINAGQSRGMKVDNGADMVLRHIAEAEGKPVEGLETLQLQMNMFNQIPTVAPAPQAHSAPATNEMSGLSKAMEQMQAAWTRGDQSVFISMLDQLKSASPETYRLMFTERNARWADWIRARMQTPGTVFVAVGAGHLAGKDSLLVKLAQRGLPSQRVY